MDKNIDREICELAHQLDNVQLLAALATVTAMAAGLGKVAAIAAGNVILTTAGYPSTPIYAINTRMERLQTAPFSVATPYTFMTGPKCG